ncbi:hypothetical protein HYV50_03915 [Candidatus Pacearchaeota archaeon]|nr:hypothetical protein [Candidatus Pacearchaeota archaeon]
MVGRPRKNKEIISTNSTIERYFKVYSLFQEKPYTIEEISNKTGIEKKAVYRIKDNLLALKKIKPIANKYADVNYRPLEEEMEAWLRKHLKEKFPPIALPFKYADRLAIALRRSNNEEFEAAFKRVCEKHNIPLVPSFNPYSS